LVVEDVTPEEKLLSVDHWIEYAGSDNWPPESMDSVQSQVGVVSVDGEVVAGVPGVLGIAVSSVKLPVSYDEDAFCRESRNCTLTVLVPSELSQPYVIEAGLIIKSVFVEV
jgi:hypothetical protein